MAVKRKTKSKGSSSCRTVKGYKTKKGKRVKSYSRKK